MVFIDGELPPVPKGAPGIITHPPAVVKQAGSEVVGWWGAARLMDVGRCGGVHRCQDGRQGAADRAPERGRKKMIPRG
jgi:hypothetical protein